MHVGRAQQHTAGTQHATKTLLRLKICVLHCKCRNLAAKSSLMGHASPQLTGATATADRQQQGLRGLLKYDIYINQRFCIA
jgi:hypothetical protein